MRALSIAKPVVAFGIVTITLFALFQNTTTALNDHEVSYNGSSAVPLSVLATAAQHTGGVLTIPATGPNSIVYIDRSVDVTDIIINGQLHCDQRAQDNIIIKAKKIFVNGVLQCGTANTSYNKKLTFAFKHDATFSIADISKYSQNPGYRALLVNNGGKLILTGHRRSATWVKLNATVRPNTSTSSELVLDTKLHNNWQPGDSIVVASTSFNPDEAERKIIASVNNSGPTTVLTLTTPMRHTHWGQKEIFKNPNNTSFELDERAEVVNLTRNIKITVDEPEDTSIADQMGAHVMVHPGGAAYIDSVEFNRVGQAGAMARYPFHWHVVGDAPGQFIKNSSIHESYQRCITIHKTNKTLVHNNSCYNFRGHGFFLEDGNEIDNVLTKNIGIQARNPLPERLLLASDNNYSAPVRNIRPEMPHSGIQVERFPAVSTFWISNPRNHVSHNVAAGSVGTGFWMAYVPEVRVFNRDIKDFSGNVLSRPLTQPTTNFSDNVAHTCLVGITWDGAPDTSPKNTNNTDSGGHQNDMHNDLNPADRALLSAHYNPRLANGPAPAPIFRNLRAYKNKKSGIYYRGQTAIFENAILADNSWSFFLAYNQIIKNTAIIDKSSNSSYDEVRAAYGNKRSSGIVLYDGPFEADDVHFFNFPTALENYTFPVAGVPTEFELTATPFFAIGGAARYTNITRNISFKPEPLYRVVQNSNIRWLDALTTSRIRDLDGTLTGTANAVLVPNNAFSTNPSCSEKIIAGHNRFPDFKVCTQSTKGVTLHFGSTQTSKVPFIVRKNGDFSLSLEKNRWEDLHVMVDGTEVFHNNKVYLENDFNEEYEVLFPPRYQNYLTGSTNRLTAALFSEYPDAISPVIKISGLGANCSINGGAQRLSSLAALRSSTVNSYYSDNKNQFYIKLKTQHPLSLINPTYNGLSDYSTSLRPEIRCAEPIQSFVHGNIDRVVNLQDLKIDGWACNYGKEEQLSVHVYVGGPFGGGGTLLATGAANHNSEANVGFACASSLEGHRFKIEIPLSKAIQHAGKPIYIYAISSLGNRLLPKSGTLFMPAIHMNGYVDTTPSTGTQTTLKGWACEIGKTTPINVHVYAGGEAGRGGTLVANTVANLTSENAIRTACQVGSGHYRFSIPRNTTQTAALKGKKLYFYGISKTTGQPNRLLNGSGNILVP